MIRGTLLSMVAFGLAAMLWVAQCSGPRPVVVGPAQIHAPDQPGSAYHVEARIRNEGPGHGEARATFRLIDGTSGEAYQKDVDVELEPGETARVVAEIAAPPAAYRSQVEVKYPPE
jgi:hypothetical protein